MWATSMRILWWAFLVAASFGVWEALGPQMRAGLYKTFLADWVAFFSFYGGRMPTFAEPWRLVLTVTGGLLAAALVWVKRVALAELGLGYSLAVLVPAAAGLSPWPTAWVGALVVGGVVVLATDRVRLRKLIDWTAGAVAREKA